MGRDLPAAGDLRQPLVRPQAGHRGRADLLGPVHRRRASGRRSSSGDRRIGLADDDIGLRRVVMLGVLPLAALFLRPAPGAFGSGAGRVVTRMSRARVLGLRPNAVLAIICARRVLLLRADGDPAGPSRRVLQRYRRIPATGAAMLSVLLGCAFVAGSSVGLDRRPPRRPAKRCWPAPPARRWRSPASCDPERGRAVRDLGRLRARLQRHHPGLCRGDARAVPGRRGVVAGAERAVRQHGRHGVRQLVRRRAVRPIRLLHPGVRWPCCSTSPI